MFREADSLLDQHRGHRAVHIRWTRGHVGTPDNEVADGLAGRARTGRDTNWSDSEDAKLLPRPSDVG